MRRTQRVIAVVQARTGSTRLPGKVLAEISGRPMVWHVVNRVRMAATVDCVVVATSIESADNPLADFCSKNGIECFRGSESDVLDRVYHAAKQFQAEVVVRITADCPLIDHCVIDKVVATYLEGGSDYVTNTLHYTYPDGLDVEVFSFPALERAWIEARLPSEREHVTLYLRASGQFKIRNVENEEGASSEGLRWTVDVPADLEFVRAVYAHLGENGQEFGFAEILDLLSEEPGLMQMNEGIIRNEGYYKSLAGEPGVLAEKYSLKRSQEFKARAEQVIPSCSQTFSKGPTQFVQGVAPNFLERGQGSHVWDVDGNEYFDYAMGLGPIILGHCYPAVTEAVKRQLQDGTVFTLPHPLEVVLAEKLLEIIPCAEMVRFGKNGSDVTAGAVRVARAYTARDVVACAGYHGWQDWYIGTTTRNKGVPRAVQELTHTFQYNNLASLERIFAENPGQVAAVILEPIGVVVPEDKFLQKVQDLTQREGALLIFDEVITGFRLALGGAQEYFGVTPDLACMGKAMGNGFPVAAVVGRRDIMELFDEIFFSFTFGGEALSLAAARATIEVLERENVIGHIWEQGRKIRDGYNVLAREFGVSRYTECLGLPPRTVVTFKDESGAESLAFKSLFQQECLKRGVLFSGAHNLCYSHSNADIEHTLHVYRTAIEILAEAIKHGDVKIKLEGKIVQPVFRRA